MIPICIATITIDDNGSLEMRFDDGDARYREVSRRVSRVATLDGESKVMDGGSTSSDNTILLDITRQPQAVVAALRFMVSFYAKIIIFTPDGAYTAVPQRINDIGRSLNLSLLVTGPAEIKA